MRIVHRVSWFGSCVHFNKLQFSVHSTSTPLSQSGSPAITLDDEEWDGTFSEKYVIMLNIPSLLKKNYD